MNELIEGISDLGTLVEELDLTGGGEIKLGIDIRPTIVGLDVPEDPHVTFSIDDLGDVLNGTPPNLTVDTNLGDLDFDVLLADENAKVNLNAMRRDLPLPAVTQIAKRLTQSTESLQVTLRPFTFASAAIAGEEKQRDLARLNSWGQVFPMRQFTEPADAPRRLAAATMDLTCWGNGKLNVLRASEAAVQTPNTGPISLE